MWHHVVFPHIFVWKRRKWQVTPQLATFNDSWLSWFRTELYHQFWQGQGKSLRLSQTLSDSQTLSALSDSLRLSQTLRLSVSLSRSKHERRRGYVAILRRGSAHHFAHCEALRTKIRKKIHIPRAARVRPFRLFTSLSVSCSSPLRLGATGACPPPPFSTPPPLTTLSSYLPSASWAASSPSYRLMRCLLCANCSAVGVVLRLCNILLHSW